MLIQEHVLQTKVMNYFRGGFLLYLVHVESSWTTLNKAGKLVYQYKKFLLIGQVKKPGTLESRGMNQHPKHKLD